MMPPVVKVVPTGRVPAPAKAPPTTAAQFDMEMTVRLERLQHMVDDMGGASRADMNALVERVHSLELQVQALQHQVDEIQLHHMD